MKRIDFTGDASSALQAARECLAAMQQLRRDFVHFHTDDGGLRFVNIADACTLHELEWDLETGGEGGDTA